MIAFCHWGCFTKSYRHVIPPELCPSGNPGGISHFYLFHESNGFTCLLPFIAKSPTPTNTCYCQTFNTQQNTCHCQISNTHKSPVIVKSSSPSIILSFQSSIIIDIPHFCHIIARHEKIFFIGVIFLK